VASLKDGCLKINLFLKINSILDNTITNSIEKNASPSVFGPEIKWYK
jgi:hypothetical protein